MARRTLFQTKEGKPIHGLRITLTMEAESVEGMRWAIQQGFQFANERWIGVGVSKKGEPATKVKCRTTRLRKPRPTTETR